MESTTPILTPLVLLLLFSLAKGLHNPKCDAAYQHDHDGSTLQVFHVFSPCSPFRPSKPMSWEESVLQLQAKDQARMQYLSNLVARRSIVPIASGRQITQSPTYIVRAKFGTPAQTLLLAMDTSNDAAWVPCTACVGCSTTTPFAPPKSTTFKKVGCGASQCKQVRNPTCDGSACAFNFTYGTSSVAASLVQDTVTLATDPVPAYTFGCIQKATGSSLPPQGLLGLGRGPLSLLAQTQKLYQSTFSYCLPSFKTLNFSDQVYPSFKNPRRSSLYYVNLVAIRVGPENCGYSTGGSSIQPYTGAGTVFDSGTVFTRLVEPAYTAVRNEFRRRVSVHKKLTVTSLGGFDTCYTVPIVAPTITFMFSGMNVTLPPDNILIHSTAGSVTCLAMAPAPDNVNSVLNVIANMQQQNHRVLFDVPNSRLGVARELCT
uniref:Peptidase A1 domain-containing protein n=1 Tax=Glycine max TaxID=3847 RepID=K7MDE4_SOYBN